MRSRRKLEIIAGRVNADGSIAAGDGFTVQKTGTGGYTVTLAAGFRLVAAPTAGAAGGLWVAVTSAFTDRSFVVGTYTTGTNSAADIAFTFIAAGIQL